MSTKGRGGEKPEKPKKSQDSKKKNEPINTLQFGPSKVVASFLTTEELSKFRRTEKRRKEELKPLMDDKKKAAELLDSVFNKPSCKEVEEWIKQDKNKLQSGKSIALVRTNGVEQYFSKKENKMITKRTWKDMSPLEAAAISGDNFLVRTLLDSIPDNQKHEAALQLQEIKNRKDYLEPFITLQEAYKEYIKQHPTLSAEENWKVLDNLELQIGLCQRLLPTYGIQEYCDDKPFSPVPDFDKEPKRSCLYYDGSEVDFDLIGTSWILYKGLRAGGVGLAPGEVGARGRAAVRLVRLDSAAINYLCEVCTSELESIIQSLLKLKPSQTDTPTATDDKNSRRPAT